MIRKKICMVGVYATGKTSLVRMFVHATFSQRYHSTVGVKIDRKQVEIAGEDLNLVLWDLAGRDGLEDIQASYVKGASGILYVVDGTRRETFDQLFELRDICVATVGEVPSIAVLNKSDLSEAWCLGSDDLERLSDEGLAHTVTSARTGEGVDETFLQMAAETQGAS